jgi:hypothetical protein
MPRVNAGAWSPHRSPAAPRQLPHLANPSPRGWRAFADAVALVLGFNVWVSLVLLPGLFIGAFDGAAAVIAALLPLGVLCAGIWRRSEAMLLLGFPAMLLVPMAFASEIAAVHIYGPLRFAIVGAGLIAYLFGASVFTFFSEPAPPLSSRLLSSSARPAPPRWRRRFRVYLGLTALSALFPLVLLYYINFADSNQEFLRTNYPGRAATMTAVMNLGAIGVWLLLFTLYFAGVLAAHRTGDRALVADLGQLRRDARRAGPRPAFYIGVFFSLFFMVLLMLSRYY